MDSILIVDDDIYIGNMLEDALTKEGYRVSRAYSGTEALLAAASCKPDLVLLDLMLPGLPGEEVLTRLKGTPIIVVSAKADVDNKVGLLLGGAVDYVTKPFDLKELMARIRVHLRKAADQGLSASISAGRLRMDTVSREVYVGENPVKLTKTEYAILKLLLQNPEKVIAKSIILDRIGEDTPDCTDSSLKQHVSNLRKKLRAAGGADYIEAVWGIGFKLRSE